MFFGLLEASAQPAALEAGKEITRRIEPGATHRYTLDLAAGQYGSLSVSQPEGIHDLTVKLVDPNAQVVWTLTRPDGFPMAAIAGAGGPYVLELTAPPKDPPFPYLIANVIIRTAKPSDPALVAAHRLFVEGVELRLSATAEERRAAVEKLDHAAAAYRDVQEGTWQSVALMSSSIQVQILGDLAGSMRRQEEAVAVCEANGARRTEANILKGLGDVAMRAGDLAKAEQALARSLELARETRLRNIEAQALASLGSLASRKGDKQQALDLQRQSVAILRELGDDQHLASALAQMGVIYVSLGDRPRALDQYLEALQLYRSIGDARNVGSMLGNIGSEYAYQGNFAKGLDYLSQAIAARRATGDRFGVAAALNNTGWTYIARKEPAKALPPLTEALELFRAIGDRWDEASSLTHIARAHRDLKEWDAATAAFQEALAIRQEVGDPAGEALTRYEFALLENARGNLDAAREQVGRSIDIAESLRARVAGPGLRSSLVASVRDYYLLRAAVLMQLYRREHSPALLAEAREAAEAGRARSLLDVLAATGIDPVGAAEGEEKKLRDSLNQLSASRTALLRTKHSAEAVAALDRQIDAAWTDYQAAHARALAADPRAAGLAAAPVPLETVRREALGADTALVEYLLGDTGSYLWISTADGLEGYELAKRAEIEAAARAFLETAKGGRATDAEARNLSRMILAPAAAKLAHKRLIIVADGALQYVPFAALADPSHPGSYQPLIVDHEMAGEASASSLVLLERAAAARKPAARTLAIIADPVFQAGDPRVRAGGTRAPADAAPLERLPGTRREAAGIAALAPKGSTWQALDFDAGREAVVARIGDYRFVHFATHGLIETEHPELSSIALSMVDSAGRPRDGFLRLHEISGLRLSADLVVLSACQTALGQEIRGEGLIGLVRGFMYAGAPRVVASLWKIDDDGTSELMRRFYAAMLGPKPQTPAAALRTAQLAMIRQPRWASPYYWAGFALLGDWR